MHLPLSLVHRLSVQHLKCIVTEKKELNVLIMFQNYFFFHWQILRVVFFSPSVEAKNWSQGFFFSPDLKEES